MDRGAWDSESDTPEQSTHTHTHTSQICLSNPRTHTHTHTHTHTQLAALHAFITIMINFRLHFPGGSVVKNQPAMQETWV